MTSQPRHPRRRTTRARWTQPQTFFMEVLKDGPVLVQDIKAGRQRKRHRLDNRQTRQGSRCPSVLGSARRRGRNAEQWPWEWYLAEEEEEATVGALSDDTPLMHVEMSI